MGTASAIPENLYTYSDQCTRGEKELGDWVRGVLTPAITAYERGGGTCQLPIDREVSAAVSTASSTDTEVRRVGRAFQEAGSASPLPTVGDNSPDNLPGRPADGLYRMSDGALSGAVAHQDSLAAGAALASKMTKKNNPDNVDWIIDQLDAHGGDGYFDAAFFNSLTTGQIAKLMGRRADCAVVGDDQALANALATGLVSKATVHRVVTALSWAAKSSYDPDYWPVQESAQASVLQAIAGNRTAAREFTDLMTDGDLHTLLRVTRGASGDGKAFVQAFNLLTQAGITHAGDSAGEQAFMNRVAAALKGENLSDVGGAEGALLQFVSLGLAGMVPDPGAGKTPEQLHKWMEDTSGAADAMLSKYLDLIIKSNAARDKSDELHTTILETIGFSFVPWGKVANTGSAVVDNLISNGLQSGIGEVGGGLLSDVANAGIPGGDIEPMRFASLAGTGPVRIAMWTQLAKHGYLVNQFDIPVRLDSGDRQELLSDMSRHPDNYALAGSPDSLHDIDKIFNFTDSESQSYQTIEAAQAKN
ncbi:hypothetical protein GCM10023322_44530 [Rugosimonospora acidiphila]|uniref:Uncharacterized protein n=1 Tax=Rugosimonospora acidiphila TaxID=556531 RepID=A0ABP9S2U6_9ACTN